jgi:acetolactate synthase-1/3 small subunit
MARKNVGNAVDGESMKFLCEASTNPTCMLWGVGLKGPLQYKMAPKMRHTISVLVENKFGVLARISGLFSGRGFNIHTLNVAPTHDPKISRVTAVVRGDDAVLDQITKQLKKLINVIEVHDFKRGQAVSRELILVKVKANAENRSELIQICELFRAKIINVQHEDLVAELTGDEGKITAFLSLIEKFGILELGRTGNLAMHR